MKFWHKKLVFRRFKPIFSQKFLGSLAPGKNIRALTPTYFKVWMLTHSKNAEITPGDPLNAIYANFTNKVFFKKQPLLVKKFLEKSSKNKKVCFSISFTWMSCFCKKKSKFSVKIAIFAFPESLRSEKANKFLVLTFFSRFYGKEMRFWFYP